jgi:hypothetical protein
MKTKVETEAPIRADRIMRVLKRLALGDLDCEDAALLIERLHYYVPPTPDQLH